MFLYVRAPVSKSVSFYASLRVSIDASISCSPKSPRHDFSLLRVLLGFILQSVWMKNNFDSIQINNNNYVPSDPLTKAACT